MNVVSVKFKNLAKSFCYLDNDIDLSLNDYVVCKTPRGVEIGIINYIKENEDNLLYDFVLKKANDDEISEYTNNIEKEKEILKECKKIALDFNIDIKIIDVNIMYENAKLIVSFEAAQRVDFRYFVRRIADIYKMRIELRQIGARDSAKILGALGPCGMVSCCKSFLNDFENITIKMAKDQFQTLNQSKISGICGKLLCCITNEKALYDEFSKIFPKVGEKIDIDNTTATVISVNPLTKSIKLRTIDDNYIHTTIDNIDYKKKEE